MASMENPNFLKKKYDLHKSPEVESAADRTEKSRDEKVPQKPEARIQNYLDRFKEIIDRDDPHKRERGVEALKTVLHREHVIQPDDIPQSYWDHQREIAREQGHGDVEITDQMKQQLAEVLIEDQKSSLDNWVDYMASDDAPYPDWLKYYTVRSVLNLGEYDKEKRSFSKRSKGTVQPYPELNREALAFMLDAMRRKYGDQFVDTEKLTDKDAEKFLELLRKENFGKLYAFSVGKVTPTQAEQLSITDGEWKKYNRGGDDIPLVKSLEGHGTGWCTASEMTAMNQLDQGDFHVYYSLDSDGKSTVPRAAIRMQGNKIAEIRGVDEDQNLDPYIGEVVENKLKEFGKEGEAYQKKAADMRHLTEIDKKTKAGDQLTKEDLSFLYEIDNQIDGFGYRRDPRIEELRSQRNWREDVSVILELEPAQVGRNENEANENTKAYIGPYFKGMFAKLPNMEHFYTKFPEKKVEFERDQMTIGTIRRKKDLKWNLKQAGINTGWGGEELIDSPDFKIGKKPKQLDLIYLRVKDMDLDRDYPFFQADLIGTEDDVDEDGNSAPYTKGRMTELGLELCPEEAAPHLALKESKEAHLEGKYTVMTRPIQIPEQPLLPHDDQKRPLLSFPMKDKPSQKHVALGSNQAWRYYHSQDMLVFCRSKQAK